MTEWEKRIQKNIKSRTQEYFKEIAPKNDMKLINPWNLWKDATFANTTNPYLIHYETYTNEKGIQTYVPIVTIPKGTMLFTARGTFAEDEATSMTFLYKLIGADKALNDSLGTYFGKPLDCTQTFFYPFPYMSRYVKTNTFITHDCVVASKDLRLFAMDSPSSITRGTRNDDLVSNKETGEKPYGDILRSCPTKTYDPCINLHTMRSLKLNGYIAVTPADSITKYFKSIKNEMKSKGVRLEDTELFLGSHMANSVAITDPFMTQAKIDEIFQLSPLEIAVKLREFGTPEIALIPLDPYIDITENENENAYARTSAFLKASDIFAAMPKDPLVKSPLVEEESQPLVKTPLVEEESQPLVKTPFEEESQPLVKTPLVEEESQPLVKTPFEESSPHDHPHPPPPNKKQKKKGGSASKERQSKERQSQTKANRIEEIQNKLSILQKHLDEVVTRKWSMVATYYHTTIPEKIKSAEKQKEELKNYIQFFERMVKRTLTQFEERTKKGETIKQEDQTDLDNTIQELQTMKEEFPKKSKELDDEIEALKRERKNEQKDQEVVFSEEHQQIITEVEDLLKTKNGLKMELIQEMDDEIQFYNEDDDHPQLQWLYANTSFRPLFRVHGSNLVNSFDRIERTLMAFQDQIIKSTQSYPLFYLWESKATTIPRDLRLSQNHPDAATATHCNFLEVYSQNKNGQAFENMLFYKHLDDFYQKNKLLTGGRVPMGLSSLSLPALTNRYKKTKTTKQKPVRKKNTQRKRPMLFSNMFHLNAFREYLKTVPIQPLKPPALQNKVIKTKNMFYSERAGMPVFVYNAPLEK